MGIDRKFRRVFVTLTLILEVLDGGVGAQEIFKVPHGTTLVVQIQKSVGADRAKPGDLIRAKLLAPVLKNGDIVLPKGATVVGNVVEAEPLAPPKPSRLLIRFHQANWKGGCGTQCVLDPLPGPEANIRL